MLVATNTALRFADAAGRTLATNNLDRVPGGKELVVQRGAGGVRIVFAAPATVALVSVPFVTHARTGPVVRALQVAFPTRLVPGAPAALRYALVPCGTPDATVAPSAVPALFRSPTH
jgi:hypothetical protein